MFNEMSLVKQLQARIPQSLADKLFAGAKQMQGEYRLVTALFSSGMAREMPLEHYVDTTSIKSAKMKRQIWVRWVIELVLST
jgi:hypothetical protein